MADIRPFRGIRYNPEAIGDLSLVVAPPYDVIDERARDAYYNRHPYNVIRLILNRPRKNDPSPDQPYRRAAEFFERWLAQRILIQDPVPGLYLYRQRYLVEGEYRECTGLVARVRLEEFSDGGILPHEDIMPKPFADRMRLLEHVRANLCTVYTLYSDPAEKLKGPILAEMERFPLVQFQTDDGVAHDLWCVTDDRFISRMTSFLSKKTLYIADGHHRYQTALEYSRRLRARGEITDDDDPRNFLMMMIVEMENPGLTVFPVHRVLLADLRFDLDAFKEGAGAWFEVEEIELTGGIKSGQVFKLLVRLRSEGESFPAFGVLSAEPESLLMLKWKPEVDIQREIDGDFSASYKRLDVTVLHRLLLEKLLGLPSGREAVEKNLVFTRDPNVAMEMVESGRGALAFFVNPTRVQHVHDVADHGEKMPQKSTYFYPKPCSGVVMNRITDP